MKERLESFMNSKNIPTLTPNVTVKHSIKVHDGVVSHIWRANTGQYFVLAVTLFDQWTKRVMSQTVPNKTMARIAIEDAIVGCVAERRNIYHYEVIGSAIERVLEARSTCSYSFD